MFLIRTAAALLAIVAGVASPPATAQSLPPFDIGSYDPIPGPSPWGPADNAGASNTQTPAKVRDAILRIVTGRTIRLAHTLEAGMPVFPGASPEFALEIFPPMQLGRQMTIAEQIPYAFPIGQLGTQVDALNHFGHLPAADATFDDAVFYNQVSGADLLAGTGPGDAYARLGVDQLKPYFTRGILVDMARHANAGAALTAGEEITAQMLLDVLHAQGLRLSDIQAGDVVVFRTGHGARWHLGAGGVDADGVFHPGYYLDVVPGLGPTFAAPGIGLEVAVLLADRGVAAVGADAPFVEVQPNVVIPDGVPFPVHNHLLAKSGVPLIESMALDEAAEFAAARAAQLAPLPALVRRALNPYVFAFSMDPIPVVGASGSTVAPKAIF
ncbi:cyclase family protein [Chiayiivirga flava]|uniref:Kynurenine formamidase n=1 Tax=Chiayiivirga flava TaxID=659595 RepID=A0A7W8D799_9GAMM|nr:cyclase family protein [Chiayiivirga flava]MBB5208006.1 kynurenine formamidase [Chiayiivirga flava]